MEFNIITGRTYDFPQVLECTLLEERTIVEYDEDFESYMFDHFYLVVDKSRGMRFTVQVYSLENDKDYKPKHNMELETMIIKAYDNGKYV